MSKRSILISLILFLSIGLRFFHIGELMVFIADQAIDSTVVADMLNGKFTLLGPKTSVGNFYNGPIVYYLMLPFYYIFKNNPIAGTIFQSILSVLAVYVSFAVAKRMFNAKIGLLAGYLSAVSPLFIDYSRAVFNAYPAVLFSGLVLFILSKPIYYPASGKGFIMGVLLGMMLQMHYLTISLLIFALFYPLFYQTRVELKIKQILYTSLGIILGLSPFILFELRHHFLNSKWILEYLKLSKEGGRSIIFALKIWPEIISLLFDSGNKFFGFILGSILVPANYLLYKTRKYHPSYKLLISLFVVVFGVSLLYGHDLKNHYIISYQIPLIILLSSAIYYLSLKARLFTFFLLVLILIKALPSYNLSENMHPLQQGLGPSDFKNASEIISTDCVNQKFNVAMLAQRDNRAMPLRYFLHLNKVEPLSVENYSQAEVLYVILPVGIDPSQLKIWEYLSYGGNNISHTWFINSKYNLFKLTKQ